MTFESSDEVEDDRGKCGAALKLAVVDGECEKWDDDDTDDVEDTDTVTDGDDDDEA